MKKITIPEEAYWKLLEIKVMLRCKTWKEAIDKMHKLVFEPNSKN